VPHKSQPLKKLLQDLVTTKLDLDERFVARSKASLVVHGPSITIRSNRSQAEQQPPRLCMVRKSVSEEGDGLKGARSSTTPTVAKPAAASDPRSSTTENNTWDRPGRRRGTAGRAGEERDNQVGHTHPQRREPTPADQEDPKQR
jgi:hypothetical protein